jgi:hypothetical protein
MIETFKIRTRLYDGKVTEGMLDISRSYITRGNALKLVNIIFHWMVLPVSVQSLFELEHHFCFHYVVW